jgi:hypothetical protein
MKTTLLYYSKTALLLLAGCVLFLSSCSKDDDNGEYVITGTAGVYMLCEGLYGAGTYNVNTGVTEKNYYKKVNGTNLGESANDLQRYGSKMYCVVTGIKGSAQSFVDVMDVATAKTIKRISFNSGTTGFCPRYITFYQNKAYVSCYDNKVRRIDTASLNIDGEVALTEGLEGIAVSNGKLYVANSDNYQYINTAKNVVSVISLSNFTKTKDITVTYNPLKVAADAVGNIYVVSAGNYGSIKPSLDVINAINDTKVQSSAGVSGGSVINFAGNAGVVTTDVNTIKIIDPATGKPGADFIKDNTQIITFYGLTLNGLNNDVLVADANGYNGTTGKAICFGADGKQKFSFETAGLPQHAVFTYNLQKR